MIATLRLLPVLVRRAPRQAAGAVALCAIGVAVASLVAGTIVAAYAGLGDRQERMSWREPAAVERDQPPTGWQRRSIELFEEQEIDRVDLASVGPPGAVAAEAVPVPPGVRSVPAPGTAVVSPALAELIAANPADELGDRFGDVVGLIGEEGLGRPDELVAVVGATAEQLGVGDVPLDQAGDLVAAQLDADGTRLPGEPSFVTPIVGYDGVAEDLDVQIYREMSLVAVVLVSVPALMLVGSAARLTAARRERRLAALRLAGATPGAVRALAAAETSMGAVLGAVVGVAASLLVAPALHGIELAGGAWFPSDLRLSPWAAVGLATVAVLVSVVATLASLRRVTSGPLGVARATEPVRVRWPRVLGVVVAFGALVIAMTRARGGSTALVMIAGLALVIASLGLVGPWICSLMGRLMAVLARGPAGLIAGRRVVDDPKAAYRVVSAVVLAGLVAGFLAGVLPTADARDDAYGSTEVLSLPLRSESVDELRAMLSELEQRFPGTDVLIGDDWRTTSGLSLTSVSVTLGPGVSLEQVRTATAAVRDGIPLVSSRDDLWSEATLVEDVRRGSLVILVAALVLGAASSAVAAAASVVDQRRTIARLALTGVPVSILQRARRRQSVVPLVAATSGAVLLGLFSSYVLMLGFGARREQLVEPQLLQLLAVVVGAAVIGLLSAAATRPLLVAAARSGAADEPS